jgi:hypothetical protein
MKHIQNLFTTVFISIFARKNQVFCQKIIKSIFYRYRRLPKLPAFAFLAAGPFVFLLSFLRLFVALGVVETTLKKPSSLP